MEKLPPLQKLSDKEKESLILKLWQKIQELEAALQSSNQQQSSPQKTSKNSSIPPSKEFKKNSPQSESKSVGMGISESRRLFASDSS
jgi:transposase